MIGPWVTVVIEEPGVTCPSCGREIAPGETAEAERDGDRIACLSCVILSEDLEAERDDR